MDVDVVEARIRVLLYHLYVSIRIGTAGDEFGNVLLVDHRGGLLEVRWRRQQLAEFAPNGDIGPSLVGSRACFGFRLGIANRHLPVAWTVVSVLEHFNEILLWSSADEPIAELSGHTS